MQHLSDLTDSLTHLFAIAAPLDAHLITTGMGTHVVTVIDIIACSFAIPTLASDVTALHATLRHQRHHPCRVDQRAHVRTRTRTFANLQIGPRVRPFAVVKEHKQID
jgi:hypothetical protein